MFRLGNLPTRLWNMFRKQRLEQDLSAELQAHLDLLTEENIRRGMNPTEAAHAARREFGGVEQTKEMYRERRGLPFQSAFAWPWVRRQKTFSAWFSGAARHAR